MPTQNLDPLNLVGTAIGGKYDVEEVVARTTLSVVYRARHRVLQRNVAIKAFTASTIPDEARRSLLASFVEEGRLLMDLSERCASICQARDVASLTTERGEWVPYTVLEWLDGVCLEAMLRAERARAVRQRTLAEAIDLMDPIAAALAVAHDRGVCHRDVKPGNIFVLRGDPAGRVKLLDFGVAAAPAGDPRPEDEALLTRSFTPAYGAPEQFSTEYGPTGPWTDVFALALLVVELVVGREALDGDALGTLALRSCDPSVRPTARALGVPTSDGVERVLAKALAVRPEDRFPTARAFWDALLLEVSRSTDHEPEVVWELPDPPGLS